MADSAPSLSDRVTQKVLASCRAVDPDTQISRCFRTNTGRTTVELIASSKHTAVELANALRTLLPLATVRTSKDLLSGTLTASVIVPTSEDEFDIAHHRALGSVFSRLSRVLVYLLCLGALGVWIHTTLQTFDATTLDDREI